MLAGAQRELEMAAADRAATFHVRLREQEHRLGVGLAERLEPRQVGGRRQRVAARTDDGIHVRGRWSARRVRRAGRARGRGEIGAERIEAIGAQRQPAGGLMAPEAFQMRGAARNRIEQAKTVGGAAAAVAGAGLEPDHDRGHAEAFAQARRADADDAAMPTLARGNHSATGLGTVQLAPDAPDQAEAIRAHAFQARLVVIGRAKPASRCSNDGFACNHDDLLSQFSG